MAGFKRCDKCSALITIWNFIDQPNYLRHKVNYLCFLNYGYSDMNVELQESDSVNYYYSRRDLFY